MIEMAASYFFPIMELLKIPHDFFNEMTKSTIALFVVIDPIGNVPLFIALTSKMDKNQKKKTSKVAIVTAFLLSIFAVGGTQILSIFGINIFSFMIAGEFYFLYYHRTIDTWFMEICYWGCGGGYRSSSSGVSSACRTWSYNFRNYII